MSKIPFYYLLFLRPLLCAQIVNSVYKAVNQNKLQNQLENRQRNRNNSFLSRRLAMQQERGLAKQPPP